MLDQVKLRRLKQTSSDDDGIAAADVCLELSLESKGTTDEFLVEALPPVVRSQAAALLASIITELTAPD